METITFKFVDVGWLDIHLEGSRARADFSVSWANDLPWTWARALVQLRETGEKQVLLATDENRHDFDIVLRNIGRDVETTLRKKPVSARAFRRIFRCAAPAELVVARFSNAIRELLGSVGAAAEYRRQWGHEFPGEELTKLDGLQSRFS